jgi:3-dehydroquinate synthase
MERRVTVAGDRPYDVVLGHGLDAAVLAALPDRAAQVAILHAPLMADRAADLAARISATGRQAWLLALSDAEAAKTAESAALCWESLGRAGFTRTDAIVGLGGGATTDLAGFVAATWLRGVGIVQLPTTMLAMVDAAVGGKTGINTSAGKNLVGCIHPPLAVVCDLDWLRTLPRADFAAGLAEVVKAGFIADPAILEIVERDPGAVLDPDTPETLAVAERAIRAKARVVADDLTESIDRELGREVLNYGHTFAHAIENVQRYSWRHGDAVSVGMCFAAALGYRTGRLSRGEAERHRRILSSLGLPVTYPSPDDWSALSAAMRVDKKARGATLRFVVLDGIGHPGILSAPSAELLKDAFDDVTEDVR